MSSSRSEFRVLVCGGRDFTDTNHVCTWLSRLFEPNYDSPNLADDNKIPDAYKRWWLPRPDLVLIHGAADGVDRIADDWATVNFVQVRPFPADWERWGRAAGPMRNMEMLKDGQPHLVVAFKGGTGTANMVRISRERNFPVLEIPYPDNAVNNEPAP